MSVYFMCRNLLPFVAGTAPWKLPFAYAAAFYKLFRQWGAGKSNIAAALRGLHGFGPPEAVQRALQGRRPEDHEAVPDYVYSGKISAPSVR